MNKRFLLFLITALLLLVGTALTACGDDDDDDGGGGGTDTTAADFDTVESGTLTVASDIPYAPFEFGDPPDYEGVDMDLVHAIGDKLGLDVKIVKVPFDVIFRNVAQGKYDMVASSSTITPERAETVDFSDPYFLADQSVMIKKGSDIKTVDDVAGKIVGAQLGTTGAAYAKEKTEASEVRTYDLIDDAFKALQTEQVEAVINDCPISKYAERSKPDLEVVSVIPTNEHYGFAFEKGNDALVEAVNGALAEVKQDGTYDEIFDKYVGSDTCKSITESE